MRRLFLMIVIMVPHLYAQDDFDFDFDFDSANYQQDMSDEQDSDSNDAFDGDLYSKPLDEDDMSADSTQQPQKGKKKTGPVGWEDVKAQKPTPEPTRTALAH